MRLALFGLVGLLTCSAAQADNEGMEKYRDWLPAQIKSMPEAQRRSEVPTAYVIAANEALSPLGDLALQSNLNTLMYDGVGNFQEAKRKFQVDLGENPTGDLTVGQISSLRV